VPCPSNKRCSVDISSHAFVLLDDDSFLFKVVCDDVLEINAKLGVDVKGVSGEEVLDDSCRDEVNSRLGGDVSVSINEPVFVVNDGDFIGEMGVIGVFNMLGGGINESIKPIVVKGDGAFESSDGCEARESVKIDARVVGDSRERDKRDIDIRVGGDSRERDKREMIEMCIAGGSKESDKSEETNMRVDGDARERDKRKKIVMRVGSNVEEQKYSDAREGDKVIVALKAACLRFYQSLIPFGGGLASCAMDECVSCDVFSDFAVAFCGPPGISSVEREDVLCNGDTGRRWVFNDGG